MQKFLLMVCGCIFAMTKSAYAASCQPLPDSCEDLGYKYTEEDCSERTFVRCPFDTNKVFCLGEKFVCPVGSVLYDDFKCYDIGSLPANKEPVAVVFDSDNRLAISLTEGEKTSVSSIVWGIADEDIEELYACPSGSVDKCDKDGAYNTEVITHFLIVSKGKSVDTAKSSYAAPYCYYSNEGGALDGRWFLPSALQLSVLYQNKEVVNKTMDAIGADQVFNSVYVISNEITEGEDIKGGTSGGSIVFSVDKESTGNAYVRCMIKY